MDLSIVIVSWKVRELLDKCLESVFKFTSGLEFEVIVVDNASGDGTAEMVMKKYPQVKLIASNRNLGFAKGNNEGIRISRGEFLLLLNPDTELRDNAFLKFVDFARKNPRAAICGPKLLNPDGALQRSVSRFPDLASQSLLMLKVQGLWPSASPFRRRQALDFDYSKEQKCDQVMGAAFLIRRDTLDKIGLLDEGYFLWFEEVDYCKTAAERGLETWYTPSAEVVHHGGESFSQVFGPRKQLIWDRSARRYFRKHHGAAAWAVVAALSPISYALSWLAELPKRLGMKGIKV
jgi:hypothetical protein